MTRRNGFGITLTEALIIVACLVVGMAITVPSLKLLRIRAREQTVEAYMKVFQLAVEDYGVQNDGYYPMTVNDVIPLLPGAVEQVNPFTNEPMVYNQRSPGNIIYTSDGNRYRISGWGKSGLVPTTLNEPDGR